MSDTKFTPGRFAHIAHRLRSFIVTPLARLLE